ncbi:hypothetical protein NQ314_011105 [Rhamnusium bicolor]|uniref:Glycoside hydrolase family 38 N-terminal domain-containing protein n=1 Tax=Rhamnusium bicolor TaxID=1586634 RepID=A0AAV8XM81_9CUCU|nr:hypothetical protein NQ314_011105 [Rhamnusium bicolor]
MQFFFFFTTTINPAKLYELHETDVRCGYQSCPVIDPEKLNVHLIAHSYNSLGWTSTAETLFYKNVQYIISSVVDALQVDPNRKFIQVETAYFHKWWELQNDYVKNSVKQLIDEGRLVITNGGWSMNDEATSHYQSIIDQFTLGHRYLPKFN